MTNAIPANLIDAPNNRPLRIIEFRSGYEAKRRLMSRGLQVGDVISKVIDRGGCPLLVRNHSLNGATIAIGRSIALRIMVGGD